MKRVRIVLGILILIFSIALLVWGFMPSSHETRTQPISPTELQLPTPTSLHFDMALTLSASLIQQPFLF